MPTPDAPRTEVANPLPRLIGRSAAWTRTLETAARVARGRTKVLLTGESGVGKDVIARYLHAQSPRAGEPFVAINCASLPDTLLESELFGHEKGSFTGALKTRIGKLRQAHQGTVFLDEIGEMSLRMQALLLRFLENGEVHPVGSDTAVTCVDVRVIAATNKDLFAMVEDGRFREDLLYRLNGTHLTIPSLRDRRDDIPLFVEHVMATCGRRMPVAGAVMQALESYPWPGNVRELQNVVEQMASVARGTVIELEDLPPRVAASAQRLVRAPARTPAPAGGRPLRAVAVGKLRLLGRHPAPVAQSGHDPGRPASADRAWPGGVGRHLPGVAEPVRAAAAGLQAAAQFSRGARLFGGLP